MEGLASSLAQPQQQQPNPSAAGPMPTVDEVVALLLQGIDPEKLEAQGIPVELILEAITIIEQQMAAENAQQGPQGGGLASSMAGM